MQEPKKKNSQVPQTVDSSNEGPEDFRHQLPHLFLSGDSPNNRRKCQATFGMGILTTYPETLNGMVPKIPKKRIFKLAKSSHSSTGGKTFVSAGTGEAKQQVRKTRKNDLRTLELRCLFYKVLCISNMVHIMRNQRGVYTPEKCGLQKCKRTKKKCPKIGESLRIFDIFQHRSKPSGHRCLR